MDGAVPRRSLCSVLGTVSRDFELKFREKDGGAVFSGVNVRAGDG